MIRSKEEDFKFLMILLALTPILMFLITVTYYLLVEPTRGPWVVSYKLLLSGDPISLLMATDLLLLIWSYFWGRRHVKQNYSTTMDIFKAYMFFMIICPVSASMFLMLINMLFGSLGYEMNWFATIVYTLIFSFVA